MIVISHRGNLEGLSCGENSNSQIRKALSLGFYVEVDVWRVGNSNFLGHDSPGEPAEEFHPNIIWHSKNFESASFLESRKCKWFSHNIDSFAVVNNVEVGKPVLWGFPDSFKKNDSFFHIVVVPGCDFDQFEDQIFSNLWFGICTDYPLKLVEFLKKRSK